MTVKGLVLRACPPMLLPWWERIENSPIGYRLAKGVFWSLAGTVTSRALMLVASILVARMLGKTDYGELGIINSTVGMFGVFAGFGLGITATKYVAECRATDPERAGRIIGISGLFAVGSGGLVALALLIFAPWLAEHTINAPHLAGLLRIGAIILFISALNGAQTGALSGLEAFKTVAYVNLMVGLLSFPLLVAGTYFGGLRGAVWALAINLGFNWLFNHVALRSELHKHNIPFTLKKCYTEFSILWKFSLPAMFASMMLGPVNWICSAILVNQPDGYGEMGIYNAANQWFTMLMFLPGLLGSVILPVLSERLGQKDTTMSSRAMTLAMKANALVVFPLVLFASILSPFIMSLYGAEFAQGWPTLIVILLTTGLLAVQTPVGQIIAASGRMWTGFAMNMGWAIIFIIGTVVFVNNGSFGLATARLISYIFHAAWTFAFAIMIIRKGKSFDL